MKLVDVEGKYKINEGFTIQIGINRGAVRVPVDINDSQSQIFHDTVIFEKGNIIDVYVLDPEKSDFTLIILNSENSGIKHKATFTINNDDDESFILDLISKYLEKI